MEPVGGILNRLFAIFLADPSLLEMQALCDEIERFKPRSSADDDDTLSCS